MRQRNVLGLDFVAKLVLGVLALVPASARAAEEATTTDSHSYGNPNEVAVRHLALNLATDFNRKELRGKATLTLERAPGAAPEAPLILDSRGLNVRSVIGTRGAQRFEIPFAFGPDHAILGAPLRIELPADVRSIEIYYTTSPEASALQWVEPSGTEGGKRPFLYSQSQAIHARSWFPCQDSPAARVTYEAEIHAPEGLTAVMSAETRERQGSAQRFVMNDPIPPYLIALAVGELQFQEIGPRTGVWAEPSVVDAAAHEFADTEAMLTTAEKLFGPYRWGRYDLLVLPPSFPFGGMENARLTFATPTVIAGDRSLVALVAHELAHSWSGNLVTNATWNDFWLNEGFTVYLERRIIEDVFGRDRRDMEAVLGKAELEAELKRLDARDQSLVRRLNDRDPDEAMTLVAYEKGALLLERLESLVGRERFDAFLRDYFDHFAFQSITTADFESFARVRLLNESDGPIDLDTWLRAPGLPPDAPVPTAQRFEAVEGLARDWLAGNVERDKLDQASRTILAGTMERIRFLNGLPDTLPVARLQELDAVFAFTEKANPEVAQVWFLKAIRSGYEPADARLEAFLTRNGRRKYLMPLYEALAATPEGKEKAQRIYEKARPRYHPISRASLDPLLGEHHEAQHDK